MDKKFLSLVSVLFLATILFISLTVFNKQIAIFTRASQQNEVSSSDSLVFVDRLIVPLTTNQDHSVTINVFLRDANKNSVANKLVTVSTNYGLIISNNVTELSNTDDDIRSATTTVDKNGKAIFTLKPETDLSNNLISGTAVIKVSTINDGQTVEISQSPSVKFEL